MKNSQLSDKQQLTQHKMGGVSKKTYEDIDIDHNYLSVDH